MGIEKALQEKNLKTDMEKLKYIDIKTAAEMLSYDPQTLYRKVYAGEIPFHRIKRNIRFKSNEIKVWIDHDCPSMEMMKKKGLI